ncbi:unnamed protein product, partial [Nesidiocoris tenuis]
MNILKISKFPKSNTKFANSLETEGVMTKLLARNDFRSRSTTTYYIVAACA